MSGHQRAKALGVDKKSLRNWETGRFRPLRRMWVKITEVLGLDPSHLYCKGPRPEGADS